MKATVLNRPGSPIEWTDLPDRQPGVGKVRVNVLTTGVCCTDQNVLDGEAGREVSLASLLCAELIGWRSLRIAGDGKRLGIYGFGAAGQTVGKTTSNPLQQVNEALKGLRPCRFDGAAVFVS